MIKKINLKFIFLLLIFLSFIYYAPNIYYKKMGYGNDAIAVIKDNTSFGDIKTYSKTLDSIAPTSYYVKKFTRDYESINYFNDENFLYHINILLDKGYSSKVINLIYNKLDNNSIFFICDHDYINYLEDFLRISYFKSELLERYLNYYSIYPESTISNIVCFVNMNLDYDFYSNASLINNPDDTLVLVNKYYYFDNNYVPNDLVSTPLGYSVKNQYLRKKVLNSFIKMADDAKLEGIYFYIGSGYRSFDYQNNIYNNYVNKDGFDNAERYSARAGFSEHQSGLAIDILNRNFNYISASDIEYSWLISNAYKYGFILRYPSGKENITGYMYEEWHFRFVGKDVARTIYENNITFDEYIAKK